MRIGFVATRLAGIDGASLEAVQWITVLKRMGHEVFACAGDLDSLYGPPGMLVPEMHFSHPLIREIQRLAFDGMDPLVDLDREIERKAQGLAVSLRAFIEDFELDMLVVVNAWSLPVHLPLGLALYDVVRETGIPTIAHHHHLHWRSGEFLVNRVPDLLLQVFPPDLPSVRHVVLSRVAQRDLLARCRIESDVIPNMLDFENPPPPPDDYSQRFREEMGFAPDDMVILQPTRLLARNSVERAIELAQMLGKRQHFRFVVTGESEDETSSYFEWLLDVAVRAGVDVYFIGDRIGTRRGTFDGERIYRPSDVYSQTNLVTILSQHEPFGSTLLQAMYFKLPLVVNTYPAYRADIRPAGVQAIEIDEVVTPHTAVEVLELLNDPARIEQMTENNYQVGLEHFSYRILERKLAALLDSFEL
jgi:glycosyltransferase involved in cell wall biosynthesis